MIPVIGVNGYGIRISVIAVVPVWNPFSYTIPGFTHIIGSPDTISIRNSHNFIRIVRIYSHPVNSSSGRHNGIVAKIARIADTGQSVVYCIKNSGIVGVNISLCCFKIEFDFVQFFRVIFNSGIH